MHDCKSLDQHVPSIQHTLYRHHTATLTADGERSHHAWDLWVNPALTSFRACQSSCCWPTLWPTRPATRRLPTSTPRPVSTSCCASACTMHREMTHASIMFLACNKGCLMTPYPCHVTRTATDSLHMDQVSFWRIWEPSFNCTSALVSLLVCCRCCGEGT